MSDPTIARHLSAALYSALARRKISNEDRPLATRVAEIVKATGSQKAAAALIGVGPQTLRRWVKGTQAPSAAGAARLKAAGRRVRLGPVREANIRTQRAVPNGKTKYGITKYNHNAMTITGTFQVSSDERERTIQVGKHIHDADPEAIGRILDAWLAGDDATAAAELLAAIREHYVADLDILSISKIEFS